MSNIDMSQMITAEEQASSRARERQRDERAEALTFLAQTDWYVLRAAESGAPIPKEIRAARQAARKLASP